MWYKKYWATYHLKDVEWQIIPKVWNSEPPKSSGIGVQLKVGLDQEGLKAQIKARIDSDTLSTQVDEADSTQELKIGIPLEPINVEAMYQQWAKEMFKD